ncbi:ribonuclease E/G [Bradyrhizobium sp. Tv2a-2]|uniref:Rne/Rng family ribonuclease n=1 Tax=Bradyrhizobium sp. Tv2a-2 TaxID=113395 RepID=UPI0004663351|nr:ribonuclease E/G [Bradyrhizobium sp. Tv2a-2]
MPNKMLIDATHPEETRVVVVRGNRVEEFDFETAQRKQLRGNIYLAKVTRVEPSLQAAFVEYGGNRHGFLAFSEIHPDYYQIPVADRQALIEAEERAHREAEEETENRSSRRRSRHRNMRRRGHGDRVRSAVVEAAEAPANGEAPVVEHSEHQDAAHYDAEHTLPEHGYDEAGEHPTPPLSIAAELGAHAHDDEGIDDHGHDEDHHGHEGHDDEHIEHEAHDAVGGTGVPPPLPEVPASLAAVAPDVLESPDVREVHDHTKNEVETLEHGEAVSVTSDVHTDEPAAGEDHAAPVGEQHAAPVGDDTDEDDEDGEDTEEEDLVESVGGDDVLEEVPERSFRPRRQYKIQEVIKRRQVMLVQVVKEERGNKGAALTTYLSLAGRYAVLMPNTARGGGISRKITSAQDRSRLKEVVQDLDVPEGMGIILRTAGASRTPPEIKRDFEYLIRLWETVRDTTLKSQAPTLVYEEGSLIKRSLRDLYNKEIDEILVAGEAGYREAHDFMKMLMPTNVRAVKQYRDGQPLFSRMGVESQLDAMFSPVVQLRSGGYIVINQTEALVSIDVNSGRATREHHIEDTALKTNLEAAEEVARQLRLRDLAGLIVIDFIDMDEKRNNRAVERKLSDCLRQDRARIQVGRISHFGLLEMSRQRIRASVLESSTEPCPQCGGTGHVRSVSSVALQLLRGLEETLMKGATHNLVVRTRTDVALYVLNHKRGHLRDLENSFKVTLAVIADPSVSGQQSYIIDRGEQVHTLEAAKALLAAQAAASPPPAADEAYDDDEAFDIESESEVETEETEGLTEEASAEGDGQRRKRRRRRRGRGEAREAAQAQDSPREEQEGLAAEQRPMSEGQGAGAFEEAEGDDEESEDIAGVARADQPPGERRPRRRGRRGGRRRRGGGGADSALDEGLAGSISDEFVPLPTPEVTEAVADFDGDGAPPSAPEALPEPVTPAAAQPITTFSEPEVASAPQAEAEHSEKAPRRSTVREKVSFLSAAQPEAAPAPVAVSEAEPQPTPVEAEPSVAQPAEPAAEAGPRRAGWWSRRFGNRE